MFVTRLPRESLAVSSGQVTGLVVPEDAVAVTPWIGQPLIVSWSEV